MPETLTCTTNVRRTSARGAGRDAFGLAVCRALAPPPVAVELCLPLVRAGGRLVIWAGAVDDDAVARPPRQSAA